MFELPDGSGCFTGIVGARQPGMINWLKYHKGGYARRWLFVWRMYRFARIEYRPSMGRWRAARAALACP